MVSPPPTVTFCPHPYSLWFAHVDQYITTLALFQPGLLVEELAVEGGSLWFGHVDQYIAPFQPGLLVGSSWEETIY